MLKIDLLPESYRKSPTAAAAEFHRLPILRLILGVAVVLALVPMLLLHFKRQALTRLSREINALRPRRAEIEQVQQVLQELRKQEAAFSGLSRESHYYWSQRLNTLSNVTPDGVWFSELALEYPTSLIIRGSAIGDSGSEMMKVGRLVQDLKADAGFSTVVKDIQIESIKRIQEGDVEIVNFTLTCALAPPQA